MTKALTRIQEFLKLEASAGLVLMAMALLAMLFANTALAPVSYTHLTLPTKRIV